MGDTAMVEFAAGAHKISGHLATPASGSGPGVIVLHAWWGLNDFFKTLCRRLADTGFVALAPDLYHGAVAATIAEAKQLRSQVERDTVNKEMSAAVAYLEQHPAVHGNSLGVVGFSLGAHWALWLADHHPGSIGAVVLYYGTSGGRFTKTRAAFLGHFAEHDTWGASAQSVQALEMRLRMAGHATSFYTYPDTRHWFAESDCLDAYDAEAAQLAWERSIEFLQSDLK
jgi:carboxymethylenebutenolidase